MVGLSIIVNVRYGRLYNLIHLKDIFVHTRHTDSRTVLSVYNFKP